MVDLDFSKLKYDISKVPAGKCVIDVFPELADYKEFSERKDDKVTRWIILLIDDQSPFFKMHNDFHERAKAVYKYLELDHKLLKAYIDGEIGDEERENRFRIDVNGKIFKFFILLDNHSYLAWYTIWSNFHDTIAFLQIPIDPLDDQYEAKFEKKQKIGEKLPAMQGQLAHYEKLVFGDTKIKQIAVNQVAKITNWPEKFAVKQPEYN